MVNISCAYLPYRFKQHRYKDMKTAEDLAKEIIERLEFNIRCCSDKTKDDRARKGAYVDSLVIVKQLAREI